MKSSSFLFFIQLISLISALPTSRITGSQRKTSSSATKSQKRSQADVSQATSGQQNLISVPLGFSAQGGFSQAGFTATVGLGNPPTNVTLIVDTGTGFTIVGATSELFVGGNETFLDPEGFIAAFGNFKLGGSVVGDQMTLAPDFVLKNQTFGLSTVVAPDSFAEFLGILGLNIRNNTETILPSEPNRTIAPLTDTAFEQGVISREVFGVSLTYPQSSDPSDFENVGELNFGGADPTLFCGDLKTFPKAQGDVGDFAWALETPAVQLGNTTLQNDVIVVFATGDFGIYLQDEAFQAYQNISGGTSDAQGTLHFTQDQFDNLQPLTVKFDDTVFSIPASAQVLPQGLNKAFNHSADDIVGLVQSSELVLGENITFFGAPFSAQFYMTFDTNANEIGIAPSINSAQCSSS